jgi:hypothetical protein
MVGDGAPLIVDATQIGDDLIAAVDQPIAQGSNFEAVHRNSPLELNGGHQATTALRRREIF